MDIVIIFDEDFDINHLDHLVKQHLSTKPLKGGVAFYLFPLTSNYLLINKVQQKLNGLTLPMRMICIDSAGLIHDAVNKMQASVHTWSETLGNLKIAGKRLKQWFLYPDKAGSAWWLGLIAEKNTAQDLVFFKIAQMNAIKEYLGNNHFDYCLIKLKDSVQNKIISEMSASENINSAILKNVYKSKQSIKSYLRLAINRHAILAALLNSFIWLKDSLMAKNVLPDLRKRLAKDKSDFAFVTYFPHVDEEAAKNGVFINQYARALQDELKTSDIKLAWLAMPVFYNGHRFKSALALAQQLITHGEPIFLLQEFFSVKIFFRAWWWWLKQSILSEILLRFIPVKSLLQNLAHREVLPYMHYLWRHSFVGTSGMRGIIFYLTYQQFFKNMQALNTCLYYCEMQAWEKALNMAKKKICPQVLTHAFQHTVVMRNYFNYFYSSRDISQQSENTDLPLPDKLIANGELPYQQLSQSQYPNLYQAEAIRQLYLNQYYADNAHVAYECFLKKKVLLICGSYDKQETKSLISWVYTAFPNAEPFEIWFKASPVNPLKPLFAELDIDLIAAQYTIADGKLADLLASATIAFVANTTVAIEAAAFGCDVIIPLFADTMLMNPIIETNAKYDVVNTPDAFRNVVDNKMTAKHSTRKMNKDVIHQCWNINPELLLWKEILSHAKDC